VGRAKKGVWTEGGRTITLTTRRSDAVVLARVLKLGSQEEEEDEEDKIAEENGWAGATQLLVQ
jgi:hypothetical protein